MKNIYILLLVLLSTTGKSQIVTIPDTNFKAKLLSSDTTNEIAKDADDNNIKIDANNNGEIDASEALAVHKLFYFDDTPPPFRMADTAAIIGPITDLTGIAAFANLEYLNVNSNELATLDLSSNTMLKRVYCRNNLLTSINLTGLVNLTYLSMPNNSFSSFSTAGLPALVTLDCHVNSLLQTLTFSNNPALLEVDCSVCQLSSLDVSGLSGLKRLECGVNDINALNLGSINQLTFLGCSSNQLGTLDITHLNQLKILNCNHNLLEANFDFSNMPEMVSISCGYNAITSLVFSNNFHLNYVNCEDNNLASLDFSNTSLYQLYANNNPNLTFVNVKNGIITPDIYVSQFPEPPFTSDNFQLQNTHLDYICHDEGEFGPDLVANEGLEDVSRGSYCSFTPGGNYNTISGNITFDCGGSNSPIVNQAMNVTSNLQSGITYTNANAIYQFYTAGNTVTVAPQFSNPDYFTVTPPNFTYNLVGFGNNYDGEFCVAANGVHPDLEVSILPVTAARPGFDAKYKIVYTNKGNQVQSGSVTFSFDDSLEDFFSAIPTANSQTVNNLVWDFNNLIPNQSREIELILNINSPSEIPPVNIGDLLSYGVYINSPQTDETPDDNGMNYNQPVVGSFDPNDKEVVEGPFINEVFIDNYLHYIVRFQNTGNASAENVVVKDILSSNLDWTTLQMVSASHPYRSTLTSGNKFEVFFENINLPTAASDEAGSHGYIAFKVKPKQAIQTFDTIDNTANIYFDFNKPIVTNTVSTMIQGVLNLPDNQVKLFNMYPNPTSGVLNIKMSNNQSIAKTTIVNLLGQTLLTFGGSSVLDVISLNKGTYFVTVDTDNGKATQKFIKL